MVPVAGAHVVYEGKTVGSTTRDGSTTLSLLGEEGQSFDLRIVCPDGYRSPAAPVTVVLRRLDDPGKVARYRTSCPPTTRSVVVAIAADEGANLPVIYLGSEVGRTDAAGAANVLLHVAPGEPFALSLATTGKGAEALRPRNPVAIFTAKEQDDVFVFNPHFSVERKPKLGAPQRRGPTEVGR
jgi:hypothetical protein